MGVRSWLVLNFVSLLDEAAAVLTADVEVECQI